MSIQELMRAVLRRCLCLGPDGGSPLRSAQRGKARGFFGSVAPK